jgi:hypothetical protein
MPIHRYAIFAVTLLVALALALHLELPINIPELGR